MPFITILVRTLHGSSQIAWACAHSTMLLSMTSCSLRARCESSKALPQIPKKMDVLAVAEVTGFGYPFGGGTGYSNIRMVQPCEIITVRGADLKSSVYFRWDSIPPSQATEEEALKEVFNKFQSAVRRRLRGDKVTLAYLSGGLDSRCVVAALRAEGAKVHTFNFSPVNSQDQVFGREFAEKSGSIQHEVPNEHPDPDWSMIMAEAVRASPTFESRGPSTPTWSGLEKAEASVWGMCISLQRL